MNTSPNTAYKSILTGVITAVTTVIPVEAGSNNYMPISSYNHTVNYATQKQTTVDTSKIQNTVEMLKKLEIASFNETIQSKFETSITQSWIPAETFLEKSCLFVQVDNQTSLMQKYDDFELELYLALKNKVDESHFFDMIALM
jgi:hypothetical protein